MEVLRHVVLQSVRHALLQAYGGRYVTMVTSPAAEGSLDGTYVTPATSGPRGRRGTPVTRRAGQLYWNVIITTEIHHQAIALVTEQRS